MYTRVLSGGTEAERNCPYKSQLPLQILIVGMWPGEYGWLFIQVNVVPKGETSAVVAYH